MTSAYFDLVARSIVRAEPAGIRVVPALNAALKPHQALSTAFALEQGRAALFLDTGLGKTLAAQEWGRVVVEHTNKPVLMLAPLGVTGQHLDEAVRFDVCAARVVRSAADVGDGLNIANYERLHLLDPDAFGGIILDESSIIKCFSGITTRKLMAFGERIPFRLACTATPAPNDHMELGQHCQFLGVMRSNEMLTRWFIADQRNMGRYRLKRAAVDSFWSWVASWSRCAERPSDLGCSDDGYELPPLKVERHRVEIDVTQEAGDSLIRIPKISATSIHQEKRLTAGARAERVAEIVAAQPDEQWLIWCETDYEAEALAAVLPEAIEVRGSDRAETKEERLLAFGRGEIARMITKPSIAGFGLNYQRCARHAFGGFSFSYERFYQAIRRSWRYGQTRAVEAHIPLADTEATQWAAIQRKSGDHEGMKVAMRAAMRREVERRTVKIDYAPQRPASLPSFLKDAA